MQVASIVESAKSEGIGERFVIWTQGCSFHCPGCCNPHLWSKRGGILMTVPELNEKILAAKKKYPAMEGITFVGGEPLEQANEVAEVCKFTKQQGLSVMIFTGFLLENLQEIDSPVLPYADVLVDGLYVQELRTLARRFVGSTNQRMHFLTNFYSPADPRWAEPNTVEIIYKNDQFQVIGFPFNSISQNFGPKKNKE